MLYKIRNTTMAPKTFPANDEDGQGAWFRDGQNHDFREWIAEEKWNDLAALIVRVIGRDFFDDKYPTKKRTTLFDEDPIFHTGMITTLHGMIRSALEQSRPSPVVTSTEEYTYGFWADFQRPKTNSMSWLNIRKNLKNHDSVGGHQAITLDEMVSAVVRDVKNMYGMDSHVAGYHAWLEAAFIAYLPHVIVEEDLRDPSTYWQHDVSYALEVLHLLARHELRSALSGEMRRLEHQIGELASASEEDLRDLHDLRRARGLYVLLGPDSDVQFYLPGKPNASGSYVLKIGANPVNGTDVRVP